MEDTQEDIQSRLFTVLGTGWHMRCIYMTYIYIQSWTSMDPKFYQILRTQSMYKQSHFLWLISSAHFPCLGQINIQYELTLELGFSCLERTAIKGIELLSQTQVFVSLYPCSLIMQILLMFQTLNIQSNRVHSLKYLMSTTLGSTDIGN